MYCSIKFYHLFVKNSKHENSSVKFLLNTTQHMSAM